MTPDQLPQLIAAFGAPAALIVYVLVNSQRKVPDQTETVAGKLDQIKDDLHDIKTRLSVLEYQMDSSTNSPRPRR